MIREKLYNPWIKIIKNKKQKIKYEKEWKYNIYKKIIYNIQKYNNEEAYNLINKYNNYFNDNWYINHIKYIIQYENKINKENGI